MGRSPFSRETRRSTEVCTTNNICQGTYEINVHREWWYGPITSWIKDVVYWNSDTIDMYNIILMEVQWVKKYTSWIRGTDVMTYLKENIGKYICGHIVLLVFPHDVLNAVGTTYVGVHISLPRCRASFKRVDKDDNLDWRLQRSGCH